jgi:hypothetical protein
METPFYEEVTVRSGSTPICSTVRPATSAEIAEALALHQEGKCPHTIVRDEEGWPYDFRYCVTCGAGLGAI